MIDWRLILAPLLLIAQAPIIHWAVGREHAPMPPALWAFSPEFGAWKKLQDDPIAADVGAALQADRLLSRTYLDTSTNQVANLFVAWFRSERAGTSQPHSPKWCLPAAGWVAAATGELTLETSAGAIRVNRYVVAKREQRMVVLYWYQRPHRVTAGEWETKFYLVADALWDKRTDTALVRVAVQSDRGGDQAATAAATRFAERLYPLLRKNLPQ